MSSTYSNSLRIELIGSGDQAGAWGSTTDNNFGYILDTAIAGYQTVSVTSANQALTYLSGATSTAGLNQSVYAMLRLTTTTTAAFAIYAPPVSKSYIIYNNSGYTATIYNSTVIGNTTAAGTGISIGNGLAVQVWSDGTNFYNVDYNSARTGTGSVVFSTSPTITSPTLVTPTLTTPTENNGTYNFPTLNNFTLGTYGNIKALFETATITAAAPASTTNFDIATQAVQYYTSNTSTNFTLNIRGSATSTVTAGSFVVGTIYTIATIGTTDFTLIGAASNTVGVIFTATGAGTGSGTATTGTLNSILSIGQSVTCTLLVTNGTTAYYPNVIQIDGSTVTPKWQTGTAPSANYPSSVTVYTFSIIKTANATFTVLGSQVKFA